MDIGHWARSLILKMKIPVSFIFLFLHEEQAHNSLGDNGYKMNITLCNYTVGSLYDNVLEIGIFALL